MKGFNSDALSIEVSTQPGVVRCDWRGQSMLRRPSEELREVFDGSLEAAKASGATLEMHFETLGYFNSSTIAALIKLIKATRDNAVKLVIIYDGTSTTHKTSFEALRIFKKDDGLLELRSAD